MVPFFADVFSLIHGYFIGGCKFPCVKINMLHHNFKSKSYLSINFNNSIIIPAAVD
jgi:hypothetical protein